MAGRPKRRAMIDALERLARDEIEVTAKPLDYAEAWIASGKTMLALAERLSQEIGQPVMRETLARYLREQEGAEERLKEARTRGAHGLVDEAVKITDDGGETREELQHAKQRSDIRLWVAERWNRAELGQPKAGPLLQLNVGELHLNALRARAVTARLTEQTQAPAFASVESAPDAIAPAITEAEYTVTDEDSST